VRAGQPGWWKDFQYSMCGLSQPFPLIGGGEGGGGGGRGGGKREHKPYYANLIYTL
jgi:hypothetical protein